MLVLLGLLSGVIGGTVPPVAAAPAWKIAATPKLPVGTFGELFGVSCPTATSCYAVGRTRTATGGYRPLVEHWNGSGWKLMTAPSITGRTPSLLAVDCWSDTNCVAVGYSNDKQDPEQPAQRFAVRWDGTRWSIVATTQNAVLDAVSCPSATKCYAAGYNTPNYAGVVERWNGSTWSVMATPPGAVFLYGISCATPAACMAVGQHNQKPTGFAERWNGTSWKATKMPNIAGAESTALQGVSCPTASTCHATGMSYDGTGPGGKAIVETWNGTAWSLKSSAPTTAPSILNGVACLTKASCFAAGLDKAVPRASTLIERLSGATWSRMPSPNVANQTHQLSAIACASTTRCFAVGSRSSGDSGSSILVLGYA
jgi:hypothetical protein